MGRMQVLLASRSPRRLQLLRAAGVHVQTKAADVHEDPLPHESVQDTVQRLAWLKAQACPDHGLPVIGADTLVALEERMLGQPRDMGEARKMLQLLSDQSHHVYTGICVRFRGRLQNDVVRTRVRFRKLDDGEIERYLKHNQVLDKAGAYAVQEGAASFINGIEGPLDNVIGLPVHRTLELVEALT